MDNLVIPKWQKRRLKKGKKIPNSESYLAKNFNPKSEYHFKQRGSLTKLKVIYNYNFLTEQALKNKTYRKFNNPWKWWNAPEFVQIQIDNRNTGKTSSLIRLIFALLYQDPLTVKFVWFIRFNSDLEEQNYAYSFMKKAEEAGIDTRWFRFRSDGVYFYPPGVKRKKLEEEKTLAEKKAEKKDKKKIPRVQLQLKIIHFIGLSAVDKQRINSIPPHQLRLFVLDEMVSKSGKYVKDEARNLWDIVTTFMRLIPNNWPLIKIIMTGNNISEITPYHLLFGLPTAYTIKSSKGMQFSSPNGMKYRFYSEGKKWLPKVITQSKAYQQTFLLLGDDYAFGKNALIKNNNRFQKIEKNYKFKFNIYLSDRNNIIQQNIFGVYWDSQRDNYKISYSYNSTGYIKVFTLSHAPYGTVLSKENKQNLIIAIYENRAQTEDDYLMKVIIDNLEGSITEEDIYKKNKIKKNSFN